MKKYHDAIDRYINKRTERFTPPPGGGPKPIDWSPYNNVQRPHSGGGIVGHHNRPVGPKPQGWGKSFDWRGPRAYWDHRDYGYGYRPYTYNPFIYEDDPILSVRIISSDAIFYVVEVIYKNLGRRVYEGLTYDDVQAILRRSL